MAVSTMTFPERMRRLQKKHRAMANGMVARMGPDGLVTAHPRRPMPSFPWRSVVILLGVAFLFKAWMLSSLGAADYTARVDALAGAGPVEQAGAFVMQIDPISQSLAEIITGIRG
jgi:hypothetical protein